MTVNLPGAGEIETHNNMPTNGKKTLVNYVGSVKFVGPLKYIKEKKHPILYFLKI